MARGIFRQAKIAILEGRIDFESDIIRATLVDVSLYHPNLAKDRFIADVPEAARVATITLTGKRVEGRKVYADDLHFPLVGDMDDTRAVELLYWKDTGDESTSDLLSILGGSNDGTMIVDRWPVSLCGGDIIIYWNGGPLWELAATPEWAMSLA